ncbi:MAG: hypothetical protein JSR46_09815, partial [Verrucomicrobia bacterium]|nr:hypothetical protein [Verrucomicrobiota bacterium]
MNLITYSRPHFTDSSSKHAIDQKIIKELESYPQVAELFKKARETLKELRLPELTILTDNSTDSLSLAETNDNIIKIKSYCSRGQKLMAVIFELQNLIQQKEKNRIIGTVRNYTREDFVKAIEANEFEIVKRTVQITRNLKRQGVDIENHWE